MAEFFVKNNISDLKQDPDQFVTYNNVPGVRNKLCAVASFGITSGASTDSVVAATDARLMDC